MIRLTAAALLLATPALALAGEIEEEAHADALVALSPDGRLVTGTVDFDDQQFIEFTRVYEGEFELFDDTMGGLVGTTDEPGFNGVAAGNATLPSGYSALGAGTTLSFDAGAFSIGDTRANLWFWDGTGEVSFAPANIAVAITRSPSSVFNATLDGSANDVAGFDIADTEANGSLHQHLDLTVANAQDAPEGFYLWSFTLKTDTGLEALPVFFVHGLGEGLDEEQHEAAIDFVNLNVAPAPGVAAFGLFGLAAVARRRR